MQRHISYSLKTLLDRQQIKKQHINARSSCITLFLSVSLFISLSLSFSLSRSRIVSCCNKIHVKDHQQRIRRSNAPNFPALFLSLSLFLSSRFSDFLSSFISLTLSLSLFLFHFLSHSLCFSLSLYLSFHVRLASAHNHRLDCVYSGYSRRHLFINISHRSAPPSISARKHDRTHEHTRRRGSLLLWQAIHTSR